MIVFLNRDRRALAFALRLAIRDRYGLEHSILGEDEPEEKARLLARREAKRFERLLEKVEG
jgi:hypothetical protein